MKYLYCILFVILLSSHVFANDDNNILDGGFNFGETCNNNIPCEDDSEPKSEPSTEKETIEKTETIEKKNQEDVKK